MKESKTNPWAVLKAAAAKADQPNTASSWNSKKSGRKIGDTLIGTVGETREAVTAYGPGRVMEVTTPEGRTESLFLSQVLDNCIKAVGGFEIGAKVWVKYLGTPEGKRYQTYAVGKL